MSASATTPTEGGLRVFARLLAFLKPYRGGVVASLVLAAAAMGTGVLIPYLVGRTVDDVELDLILDTLGHCFGNRTHAANILGISIRTLRSKLHEYRAQGAEVPGQMPSFQPALAG